MSLKRKDTQDSRDYWAFVERTAKDVRDNMPEWMKGGTSERRPVAPSPALAGAQDAGNEAIACQHGPGVCPACESVEIDALAQSVVEQLTEANCDADSDAALSDDTYGIVRNALRCVAQPSRPSDDDRLRADLVGLLTDLGSVPVPDLHDDAALLRTLRGLLDDRRAAFMAGWFAQMPYDTWTFANHPRGMKVADDAYAAWLTQRPEGQEKP
jgi:hypothetical protein